MTIWYTIAAFALRRHYAPRVREARTDAELQAIREDGYRMVDAAIWRALLDRRDLPRDGQEDCVLARLKGESE